MALVDDIAELQALLTDVSTLAVRDLVAVWRRVEDADPQAIREVMLQATPEVVEQYATASGVMSAEFYDAQGFNGRFVASSASPPPVARVQSSTGWALSTAEPLISLTGSVKRMIFDTSRDTILDNVRRERGARWARYASANACPFCRLLATRGSVYRTARDAGDGNKYHDHCRCMAVPVRPGTSYEPPDYVGQWQDQYETARSEAGSGSPNDIINAWRKAI